ncbi:MAG: thiamine biosynthesis protein ThiF [Leeuwenhoekiella sp.]|nr:MAG: thiamine biosynthesis protein ThiF [Leeuwenhoekiella sp.]
MNRYQRQIILPQIGENGQHKLAESRVLVIGAGGLGCALLPYLAASGVGKLGIVDGDRIEESNLHRQVLYTAKDVGRFKAKIAKERLEQQNPDCAIQITNEFLSGKNALELFADFDVIVDATDRIGARYLINDAAVLTQKPVVYGSIHRFEGQVSVFNYQNGPTYRCLFPQAVEAPSCAEAGVLGTAVGLIGMLQAQEVMKIILGTGRVLSGELLIYNCLNATQERFQFTKKEAPQITEAFYKEKHLKEEIQTLNFHPKLLEMGIFIDVRQPEEQPRLNMPSLIEIPLGELETARQQLDQDETFYVFCQSGKRAKVAVEQMRNWGFTRVTALQEGARELSNALRKSQVD